MKLPKIVFHKKYIKDLFSRVAPNYDFMNDIMSLGIHRLWKKKLVDHIVPQHHQRVIDVAGGTGDIAILLLKKNAGCVVVCDISFEMLRIGQESSLKKGEPRILWSCGDATNLPFPDNSFDIYTIAFGLRNIDDKQVALREACRVLKPQGRFYCLEFSRVSSSLLRKIYQFYLFRVIPYLGQLVAKDKKAYHYLAKSIDLHPSQEELAKSMCESGLVSVTYSNLSGGICAIHEGLKCLKVRE